LFRQTRYGGDSVVQFPCTCHPTFTPFIVDRCGIDTGLQSDFDETGLLLLRTLRRSSQQHLEFAASAEQCSHNRPPGTEAPRRSHAKPPMRQLHWLPVEHRFDYEVSVLTYKTLNASVSQYLSQHVNRRVNERKLSSSATSLLIQPFARTDFSKRSFRCAAPSVWNFTSRVCHRKRLIVCIQI